MRSWEWKHVSMSGADEIWHLIDHRARKRCTVWKNGAWHTWNESGVGCENDCANSVNEAKEQATMAVIRQGWARLGSSRQGARGPS